MKGQLVPEWKNNFIALLLDDSLLRGHQVLELKTLGLYSALRSVIYLRLTRVQLMGYLMSIGVRAAGNQYTYDRRPVEGILGTDCHYQHGIV